jgi:uncharacterized membrane protein
MERNIVGVEMAEFTILWDWLSFAIRWLHVITAIAWIGSSFYFVALDLGLRKADNLPIGAAGEEWQVHGGGFYHVRKYLVAPAEMPEHLTWFKWESYATWLSGFALLCVMYYGGAHLYLIDTHVLDISAPGAILLSLASIAVGWVVYDLLCKSPIGQNQNLLMVVLYIVLVIMAWGYTHLFSGRAAYLHLGAFTATIMSANVFFIIIPNQKKVVASLVAGLKPDPSLGAQAKQRSLHNNYLTLPVVFLMLSNHSPLAFGTQYSWLIAALVFLMGVSIRHFFNSQHARKGEPWWTWGVTATLFAIIIWLSTNPKILDANAEPPFTPQATRHFMQTEGFEDVSLTVQGRCAMCHASVPSYPGIHVAPKGVMFETDEDIAKHARDIYLQAAASHAMPPSNLSEIEPQERKLIAAWYEKAVATN